MSRRDRVARSRLNENALLFYLKQFRLLLPELSHVILLSFHIAGLISIELNNLLRNRLL